MVGFVSACVERSGSSATGLNSTCSGNSNARTGKAFAALEVTC
jgi:hypothetical protein